MVHSQVFGFEPNWSWWPGDFTLELHRDDEFPAPFYTEECDLETSLLLVNRQVSVEAAAILYGIVGFTLLGDGREPFNAFQLRAYVPPSYTSFFKTIGAINAAFIRYLEIN